MLIAYINKVSSFYTVKVITVATTKDFRVNV
jgi:hypothetical protein